MEGNQQPNNLQKIINLRPYNRLLKPHKIGMEEILIPPNLLNKTWHLRISLRKILVPTGMEEIHKLKNRLKFLNLSHKLKIDMGNEIKLKRNPKQKLNYKANPKTNSPEI